MISRPFLCLIFFLLSNIGEGWKENSHHIGFSRAMRTEPFFIQLFLVFFLRKPVMKRQGKVRQGRGKEGKGQDEE